MIVDDHAVLREGLRMLLESQPDINVVAEAADGETALLTLPLTHPDVVLMDIGMRGMNGIELAAAIRRDHPAVNVAILSMYATTEHVYRALAAGSRGYVLKDSAGDDVICAVRSLARGKRFFSSDIRDMIEEGYDSTTPSGDNEGWLSALSFSERDVFRCVVEGRSRPEIAEEAHLSVEAVDACCSRIMEKLGVHDVPALIKFAVTHRLTSLD